MLRSQSEKPKQKPTPAYAKNKRAFNSVMTHLNRMDRPQLGGMGAMNMERSGGSPAAKNPAAPNMVEFQADIFLAIKAAKPRGVSWKNFILAYILYDSDDEMERGVHAFKVLGGRMHSVEQRVGAEFIRRAIWPEAVYLHPPRLRPR